MTSWLFTNTVKELKVGIVVVRVGIEPRIPDSKYDAPKGAVTLCNVYTWQRACVTVQRSGTLLEIVGESRTVFSRGGGGTPI